MSSYDSHRQGGSYNNNNSSSNNNNNGGGGGDGYRGRGGGNHHQGGRGRGYRGGSYRGGYNSPRPDGGGYNSQGGDGGSDGYRGRGRGGRGGGGYRGGGDRGGGGYRGDRDGGGSRGGSDRGGHRNNHRESFGGGSGSTSRPLDDNSPHAAFFRDGDFAGAEPSREPEHWYQPYPMIPPHEWTPRYTNMNAKTLNLRTDRVPLVIPELRVADDEWGDPRLDVPDKVPAIPLVGWLPVCQRNPGAKWSESQVVSVITRPIARQDLVDDELTWPACIDAEIMQRSGIGGYEEEAGEAQEHQGGEYQSWLHQDPPAQDMYPEEPMDDADGHQEPESDPSAAPPASSSPTSSRLQSSRSDNTFMNSAGIPVGSLTAAATAAALVPEGMVQPYTVTRENAKKRMIEVSWQDHSDQSAASSPVGGDEQPPSKKQRTRS